MVEENKPCILVVLAHPDDETFGMGGTLALYAARGVPVHLLCATKGEAGEAPPELLNKYGSMAALRSAELQSAAQTLGLSSVEYLGWRDSGMHGSADNQHPQALINQPLDGLTAQVAAWMAILQPQVVLTFDPYGGYGHPDHIITQQAATRAFFEVLAGKPQTALYYHSIARGFLKAAVKILPLFGQNPRKFGKNGDIDLVEAAKHTCPTHVVINYHQVAKIKQQAQACHASQGGEMMAQGIRGIFTRVFSANRDHFMQVHPTPVGKLRHDLLLNNQ